MNWTPVRYKSTAPHGVYVIHRLSEEAWTLDYAPFEDLTSPIRLSPVCASLEEAMTLASEWDRGTTTRQGAPK